jgi:hypothetical protein
VAAVGQIRQCHRQGRAYLDRKVADGMTKKEALWALGRPQGKDEERVPEG